MQTLSLKSLAGGLRTSPQAAERSRFITEAIAQQKARFDAIVRDETHSPGEKARFLKKWKAEVEQTSWAQFKNYHVDLQQAREAMAKAAPEKTPLSTHAAILLAEDLKNADPARRLTMVSSDSRYADLLQELPAHYFGLTPERHAALKAHADKFGLNDEQRSISELLEADEAQLRHLEAQRDKLTKEIEQYLEKHEPEQEEADKTAHLYELESANPVPQL